MKVTNLSNRNPDLIEKSVETIWIENTMESTQLACKEM